MIAFLITLALAVCGAFLLLLVMAGTALFSQKLGRRFAWYARHEDAYLLLLMFKGVLLAVGVGYLIGITR